MLQLSAHDLNHDSDVLVVDDEESIRYSFERFLSDAGFNVTLASGPDEAGGILAAKRFDVAVIDRIYPERLNGSDLVRQIRRLQPFCQIVLASAYPTFQSAVEGIQTDIAAYLVKPVKKDEICSVVKNAARRNRSRKDFERQKANLRSLFDASPNGVAFCDLSGSIGFVNPAFQAIFGLADRVTGQPLAPMIGLPPAHVEKTVEDLMAGRQVPEKEIEMHREGGPLRHLRLNFSLVTDARGAPLHVLIIVQDVTESREKERMIIQAQKMEAVGLLAGGIAHDFNNLLQLISGHLTLLRFDADAARIDTIEKACMSASGLVARLLELGKKGNSGKMADVNAVVEKACHLARSGLGKHIEIRNAVPPGIGRARIAPEQLEQSILNLIINARDAIGEKPFHPDRSLEWIEIFADRITIEDDGFDAAPLLERGEYARIRVSDSGPGIPAEIGSQIFDPFFTTKADGKGTGLGLSSVYLIVKNCGGAIFLDPKGPGARFSIFLPAGAADSIR